MKLIKKYWSKALLRPCIYQTVNRVLLSVCVALLLEFFLKERVAGPVRQYGFLLMAFIALIGLIVVWLRLDGINVPLLSRIKPKMHKKPARAYGDMIDHIDTEPEYANFDELSDEEQDTCRVIADTICCVICLIASMI